MLRKLPPSYRHVGSLFSVDVQQKALIWLWRRWEADPGYPSLAKGATCLSHAAGCITKVAIIGDKGFLGVEWQAQILEQTGNTITTPKRKNQIALASADI